MNQDAALATIRQWSLPAGADLLTRIESMVEPAILAGVFGASRTLAVSGLQYHLGGAEDTRQLAELAGVNAADQVLDVCCFLGGPAVQLTARYGCHVTGIDLNPVAIAGARRIAELAGPQHLLSFGVADAAQMPFAEASFSVVWNQASLNHDPAWLAEFDRLLRPGGRLALVYEHRPAHGMRGEGESGWTRQEMVERIASLGYAIQHEEDLTEREITLGWKRLLQRLDARRQVYLAACGAAWIEAARQEFREEIAAMRRLEWSNARLIAVKPAGAG